MFLNYIFRIPLLFLLLTTARVSGNSIASSLQTSCPVPYGLSPSGITSNSAILSWSSVAGATKYKVKYRPTGSPTWTLVNASTNSKTINGLSPSTTYQWRVKTICTDSSSVFSPINTFATLSTTDTLIITNSSNWKYLDNGSNQGTAWKNLTFNDASWATGTSELGYGDGDENTIVSYGTSANNKFITTYFRHSFNVTNPSYYQSLFFNIVRDDGVIIYVNGIKVFQNNMPSGSPAYNTFASSSISDSDEGAWLHASINPSLLVQGNNIVTAEIHQHSLNDSDVSFNFTLYASSQPPSPVLTRGPYLQKLSSNNITIRWRTNIATESKVRYGASILYGNGVTKQIATTEHIVAINGLSPSSKYYYSIGTAMQVIQGDTNNNFRTAPIEGSIVPVRIWGTGDFGNGSAAQQNVRNAYMNYPGAHNTNLWLWLGDNAYTYGTDAEYQSFVFNIYPQQLKKFPLFPGLGNHDYGNLGYQTPGVLGTNFPYFNIFSVPKSAEAGGIASNTAKYYSYNYANIHFIALDSYGSYNNPASPMYNWLNDDLAANTQRWTIVYFHHPPYTKGTHNSDTEEELIDMRTNIIPLLENYNVDLVLCGHSHINERSYLIKGHFGLANTFTSAMKMSMSNNNFMKSPPYNGTVYAVCGTSGKSPGTTQAGYPMPCMFFSNNTNNCSLVMDIHSDTLSCKYLTSSGTIADQFTITKSGQQASFTEPNGFSFKVYSDEEGTWLNYFLDEDAVVKAKLLNLMGEELFSFSDIPALQSDGFYRFKLNFSVNANGMYFVNLIVNGKSNVKKILVVE